MIKLYAFKNVHPLVKGYTRDFRIQWALEELGLPYEIVGLDHSAGDTITNEYKAISPFKQIPVMDDEGFVLTESGAILIYLAEKAGKLIPNNTQGRTRVIQWCFASLATVELPFVQLLGIDKFGDSEEKREFTIKWAHRVLDGVEQQLGNNEWLTGKEFTVADLLMVTVLRIIRHTDLMDSHPTVKSFYERGKARPAYQKSLNDYAERLKVTVEQIK